MAREQEASAGLLLVPEFREASTVMAVSGLLSLASSPALRDGVLKVATDAPQCVIADIRDLTIEHDWLLSVFSVLAARLWDWPGISFAVVTDRAEHLSGLRAKSIDLFVAVHPDVVTAERARDQAPRKRAVREFVPSAATSMLARRFVEEICARWSLPEFTEDATTIAVELVENTVQHTHSPPKLRLEFRRGMFTVAVSDDDPRPAVLRERIGFADPGLGLRIVAHIARRWGCSRAWAGGKVVWAVLASPARAIR
ncbi:ATP-binding protein [Amycolatopsis vancoresmycina]|uniref:STAS domain-containing protein n=1 Tax=Amycolatopsis vancoresmycina DSM 44592 TaxID=1292037 RepID=R1HJ09_9PSEU|nr:ATP-binding protein [Amycolatopsis vancoresmycina]EOD63530.1 hypothetical protein H480_36423 [Amycolatopsis vancoresmycina DSM 44592]